MGCLSAGRVMVAGPEKEACSEISSIRAVGGPDMPFRKRRPAALPYPISTDRAEAGWSSSQQSAITAGAIETHLHRYSPPTSARQQYHALEDDSNMPSSARDYRASLCGIQGVQQRATDHYEQLDLLQREETELTVLKERAYPSSTTSLARFPPQPSSRVARPVAALHLVPSPAATHRPASLDTGDTYQRSRPKSSSP